MKDKYYYRSLFDFKLRKIISATEDRSLKALLEISRKKRYGFSESVCNKVIDYLSYKDEDELLLHYCIETGNYQEIEYKYWNIKEANSSYKDMPIIIFFAHQSAPISLIKHFVSLGADYKNAKDKEGMNLLHIAVRKDNLSVDGLRYYLSIGLSLEDRDNYGYTPLTWAAHLFHIDIFRLLIENGANPEARTNQGNSVRDVLEIEYSIRRDKTGGIENKAVVDRDHDIAIAILDNAYERIPEIEKRCARLQALHWSMSSCSLS